MYKKITVGILFTALSGCDGTTDSISTDASFGNLQNLIDPGNTITGAASDGGYIQLPATIEAEDFVEQNGIRIGDTSDSGGSGFVGWIGNGDYTEYTISVPQTGIYRIDARVASKNQTAQVAFSINGSTQSSVTVTPTGGWDNWNTVSTTVNLSAGDQNLRLEYSGGNSSGLMNINWFSLESTNDNPGTTGGELDRSNWIVSSNFNTNDAYFAIDGQDNTRWTTGTKQANGQDFFVDMRDNQTFDRIILDSTESENDQPRLYTVYVSDNNQNWSEIASGTGSSNGSTVIDFDDQNATHIRISQQGSANRNWWSIHELTVFGETNTTTEPPETPEPPVPTNWNVDSLSDLRDVIQSSNQTIVMQPGDYKMTELSNNSRNLIFSGSNNTIDLRGFYLDIPVGSTEKESYLVITGDNNKLTGGIFEDTYPNGMKNVTNFVEYNNDKDTLASGLRGNAVMEITGDNNTIDGIKMTIRGSFPYGYGSMFGIGSDNEFGLDKRCGIVIKGNRTTIENSEIQQRAFCHGIYMQEPADNTLIRNTLVEGAVRETNEIFAEGPGSLGDQTNYQTTLDGPLLHDEVLSLSEDGIRSYQNAGKVTVENSTVKKMRGGVRLYLSAGDVMVTDTTSVDNATTNYNMPSGGVIRNSSGNFTNASLSDFRLSRSNQDLELTILPSPNAIGSHNIADILGNNHDIVFHRADGPEDTSETRVIVVYGNNSTIRNETEYGIVLEPGTSGNTIISAGDVRDNGSNDVTRIDLDL